jgi:hypothetical protein
MDPYLEGPNWSSLHHALSSEIVRQLAPQLGPRYIVRPAQRFVVETADDLAITTRDIYPDVSIDSDEQQRGGKHEVATAPAPVQIATVMPARVPLVTVEIRDVEQRNLVTAIEVLSPTNKRGEGYGEYLRKRRRILLSMTHLIEIDLLRQGQRVPMQQPLPDAHFFIFLSREERRPMLDVWPVRLDMRLPIIPVPLLECDPDIALDVQATLDSVYDLLRYAASIDYTRPPHVALPAEWAAWARERVEEWSRSDAS